MVWQSTFLSDKGGEDKRKVHSDIFNYLDRESYHPRSHVSIIVFVLGWKDIRAIAKLIKFAYCGFIT